MAGTVDLAQRCYTGIDPRGDTLWFDPALPDELECIEMFILYRGMWLDLEFRHGTVMITADAEAPHACTVGLQDKEYEVAPGKTLELPYTENGE
jgi:alpha,alpha-trehalase